MQLVCNWYAFAIKDGSPRNDPLVNGPTIQKDLMFVSKTRADTIIRCKNPQIAGFGISNSETFKQANKNSKGYYYDSAFIEYLTKMV